MALVILLLLSLTLNVVYSDPPKNVKLDWSNCGTESDPIKVTHLDITPDPLHIPGVMTLSADAQLTRNISSPIKASVLVKKKLFLGWVEVPCLDNIGSCKYEDLCQLSPFKDPCPAIFSRNNIPCSCPIKQGQYSVNNFTFPVKAVGPHWLEHGKYKARVTVSQESHLLACYEFRFSLK